MRKKERRKRHVDKAIDSEKLIQKKARKRERPELHNTLVL